MASSSPYATFRADAWMRESMICPRKVLREVVAPRPHRSSGRKAESPYSVAPVQGELFLFPVIVSS